MEYQVFFDNGHIELTDWKRKGAIERTLFYFLSDKNIKSFITAISDYTAGNKYEKALLSKIEKVERSGLDVPAILVHTTGIVGREIRIEVKKSVQKMGKMLCSGREE